MKFLMTGIILGILLIGADWAMADVLTTPDREMAYRSNEHVSECMIFSDEFPEGKYCCDCAIKNQHGGSRTAGNWAAEGTAPKAKDGTK